MLRLLLIRHAKAVPADPAADDFSRPLDGRGHRDAIRLGEYLAEQQAEPDLILCSAARRTRETLAGLLSAIADDCDIRLSGALYEVEWPAYLAAISGAGDQAATLALIGHNPAVHELALALAGEIAAGCETVRQRFPTGAMAMIDFEVADWRAVAPSSGRLVGFVAPRDLHGRTARAAAG